MEKLFPALNDLRILVVEDEVMIAMMLEDLLEEFGCVVEIVPSIERALNALRAQEPNGVILDMNIHGKRPLAVAEELVRRSVPFLLVTGYGATASDPPVLRTAPRLQKPYDGMELGRRMVELLGASAHRHSTLHG